MHDTDRPDDDIFFFPAGELRWTTSRYPGADRQDEDAGSPTLARAIFDAIEHLKARGGGRLLDQITESRIRTKEKVPMRMIDVEMEVVLDEMFRAVDYVMIEWPIPDDEYEPIKPLSLGFAQAHGWVAPTYDKNDGRMVGFLLTEKGRKRFLERK
jgi:hypothetical protein